jgi:hypothetical protein
MWPWNGRHIRLWGFILLGIAVALLLLGLVPGWGLTAEIDFVAGSLVAIAFLCWLAWQVATGRMGLIHGEPTTRRRRRLDRRAAARARAEALTQQQGAPGTA